MLRKPAPARNFVNSYDEAAVHRLMSTPPGELKVDSFAAHICHGSIVDLRLGLIKTYITADMQRHMARATKFQIAEARKGCSLAYKAACHLHRVLPAAQRGLGPSFGLEPDDQKGMAEINALARICQQAEYEIVRIANKVERGMRAELAKPTQRGERKKRLRSLVEALGDWWQGMGKRLTVTVDTSRRDPWRGQKQPAVVHSRHSDFIDLAQALFCDVDVFKQSEVVSTVSHVYKARSAKRQVRA